MTPPLAPDLVAVPADAPRPPVPTATWPAGKEPDFVAWMHYVGDGAVKHQEGARGVYDSALVAWVRHRFVQPEPHVVYLLRLATGALYCGITSARRFESRMDDHRRSARRVTVERDRAVELDVEPRPGELRAYPMAPCEAYVMANGWDAVVTAELVHDRVCALLLEALWTCILAGAGYQVFGNWPGDLCPAKAWLERPPPWDVNTVRSRG
jgi:hypothetical protein